jgi:hypothetical protein
MGILQDIGNFIPDMLTGGAVSNAAATQAVNAQNIAFAQQQTNYQTQMSDTSYQRGVVDMKAAGLNPMLAYSQGGASVPTGVSPQIQSTEPGNIGAGLAQSAAALASGGFDLAKKGSDIQMMQHQADLVDSQKEKQLASAEESFANIHNTRQDTSNKFTQGQILHQKNMQAHHELRSAQAKADEDEMHRDLEKKRFGVDKSLQVPDAVMDRLDQATGLVGNAVGAFTKSIGSKRGYDSGRSAGYAHGARDGLQWGRGEVNQ